MTVLTPMLSPLVRLRRILKLSEEAPELPPLLTQTVIEMSNGLAETYDELCVNLQARIGSHPEIVLSDSDVHPDYRFSTVLKSDNGKLVATKFRSATAENFLRDVLVKVQLDHSVFVPEIEDISQVACAQSYVFRASPAESMDDQFWYDIGRFIALCDVLGLNDMHTENALFDSQRLAVIDGETLFQNDLGECSDELRVLRTHVLFPHGYTGIDVTMTQARYARGCLSDLIRSEAYFAKGAHSSLERVLNLVIEGYLTWGEMQKPITETLPLQMTVRSVRFPTAVYGELLSSVVVKSYHGNRGDFRISLIERMNALWPEEETKNAQDADALARCQIPFRNNLISNDAAKLYVKKSTSSIAASASRRVSSLKRAISEAFTAEFE